MDILFPLIFFAIGAFVIKNAEQRQRIAWLAAILGPVRLEKSMETLATGYLRAIAEPDPERSEPIWRMLESTESQLLKQFETLAKGIQALSPTQARISRWPLAMPMVTRLFPNACFDIRSAVAVHAKGFANGVTNEQGLPRKAQARQLLAELFLFQHTCHWYCRSQTVASARLQMRHQTTYAQTLGLVSPATRRAYSALLSD